MWNIERRTSGYILTFAGLIEAAEMRDWVEASRKKLSMQITQFSVIVDMRKLAPLPQAVQGIMAEGQELYKKKGMTRSSVIVNNSVTAIQFERLSKKSGIDEWERYFDGTDPDCFVHAKNWAKDGIDTKSQTPVKNAV